MLDASYIFPAISMAVTALMGYNTDLRPKQAADHVNYEDEKHDGPAHLTDCCWDGGIYTNKVLKISQIHVNYLQTSPSWS